MFWPLWISATALAPLGLDHHNNPVDGWVNYKPRWVNYKERWVNYRLWWVNYKKTEVRWVNYKKTIQTRALFDLKSPPAKAYRVFFDEIL